MKKIISIVLVFVLSISVNVSTLAFGEEKGSEVLEALYEESAVKSEEMPADIAMEIENNKLGLYIDKLMRTSNEYSEYYGGVYLKNGELIVKLTNTDNNVVSYIESAVEQQINYEKCNVSKSQLEAINEFILDFIVNFENTEDEALNELVNSIVSTAIYIKRNVVCVGVKNCDDEKINLFKKIIIDSECLEFISSKECIENVTYVKAGEEIKIMINGAPKSYSMGFRCKRLYSSGIYVYGFVTAAHGGVQNGYTVCSQNGNEIGHIWGVSFAEGGTVDASFVQMINANYDCSRAVYHSGESLRASIATPIEGATIKKDGYATRVTTGEVISEAEAFRGLPSNILIRDLYETDYHCDSGDSGGVVYTPGGFLVGIHRGKSQNELYPFGYAVKAANIVSALGLTLY